MTFVPEPLDSVGATMSVTLTRASLTRSGRWCLSG